MSLMVPGSVAVIPGAIQRYRNRDTEHLFRQDSDFYYLTGFSEPDAVLVLAPERSHGEVILFCRERNARAELYNGERVGPERAAEKLGVDDGFPINDIEEILPGMLEGRERIYITLGAYPDFDKRLMQWVSAIRAREAGGAIPPGEFHALKHLLHEQRLVKSALELKAMREAARITSMAHERAMRCARPGMTETQLEAELVHEFMTNGAHTPAYPSIVGSGANACVLHYVDNASVLKKNDLVLIDAGCEYQHYAADVTRTFPVSGRFSKSQQALYEIVLEANRAGIDSCRPGATFSDPHVAAVSVMVQGLLDLKLLQGELTEILETDAYREFCPHNSSHWLGSDVHDVGDYRVDGAWRELEPGMVLTVEPGIYIRDDASTGALAPRWRGIGIRVEDDVAITSEGHEVLSHAAKDVSDIQQLMAEGASL
tara:strand:+ start:9833 stop:11116 length:1284 start_codon:yes stop_codon:yes gene_type:complete